MRILILGAGGMIGRKLLRSLLDSGQLDGKEISALDCVDLSDPKVESSTITCQSRAMDITQSGAAKDLIKGRPDVIFHLAAMVSAGAERDFEGGYIANVDATRALFEEIRKAHMADGYRPRLVFASSIAVFGAPLPDPIQDTQIRTPQTSYGTQKAIAELLIDDYSRRGYMDGIALRLPTIVIRPGKPNAAASGFFSGILREPLAGQPSRLPVSRDTKHWLASPRSAVGFLVHAATLDTAELGHHRALTMPGIAATVAGQIEALTKAAGQEAADLIVDEPDPEIAAIIANWPRAFAAERALGLGFKAEETVDELIQVYLEDDAPAADS